MVVVRRVLQQETGVNILRFVSKKRSRSTACRMLWGGAEEGQGGQLGDLWYRTKGAAS